MLSLNSNVMPNNENDFSKIEDHDEITKVKILFFYRK